MQPTNKLRFVERIQFTNPEHTIAKTVRVLQQWWEETLVKENGYYVSGEWRDVPLETEGE